MYVSDRQPVFDTLLFVCRDLCDKPKCCILPGIGMGFSYRTLPLFPHIKSHTRFLVNISQHLAFAFRGTEVRLL